MTNFYTQKPPTSAIGGNMRRKPVRATITLNWALHQRIQERADLEGRSFSNLCAHLLETGEAA